MLHLGWLNMSVKFSFFKLYVIAEKTAKNVVIQFLRQSIRTYSSSVVEAAAFRSSRHVVVKMIEDVTVMFWPTAQNRTAFIVQVDHWLAHQTAVAFSSCAANAAENRSVSKSKVIFAKSFFGCNIKMLQLRAALLSFFWIFPVLLQFLDYIHCESRHAEQVNFTSG